MRGLQGLRGSGNVVGSGGVEGLLELGYQVGWEERGEVVVREWVHEIDIES